MITNLHILFIDHFSAHFSSANLFEALETRVLLSVSTMLYLNASSSMYRLNCMDVFDAVITTKVNEAAKHFES